MTVGYFNYKCFFDVKRHCNKNPKPDRILVAWFCNPLDHPNIDINSNIVFSEISFPILNNKLKDANMIINVWYKDKQ